MEVLDQLGRLRHVYFDFFEFTLCHKIPKLRLKLQIVNKDINNKCHEVADNFTP